jgi:hypothetical protein
MPCFLFTTIQRDRNWAGMIVACTSTAPEVAGDGDAARSGSEGTGGEVGGAALEEEEVALEMARGGDLGGEESGLGDLELLLRLHHRERGGRRRRCEFRG